MHPEPDAVLASPHARWSTRGLLFFLMLFAIPYPPGLHATQAARPGVNDLPRVRVDPSGHHLQLEDGRPFFWLGDTAWFVMHRATIDEASYYLRTRAAQGFNVIQVMLLPECDALRSPSVWGELPFEEQDPLRPREAYFRRVDAFLEEAASLGLYVAIVAAWGDKVTAPWGLGPRLFTSDDPERARKFGQWLGKRYAQQSNLLWFMGGDRPPRIDDTPGNWSRPTAVQAGFAPDHDWTPLWRALAEGLLEGTGGRALISYHPQGGEATTSCFLHQESWLHVNSMQSGHGGGHDQPVWEWVARDYALIPPKPTFDSEPNYEDHPFNPWPSWDPASGYFRDHDVRKQCWRSVLAGACGVTYGHHAVWQWANGRDEVINHADRDWRDALNRPGATQMRHLRTLIESRPFFRRVPAPALVHADQAARGTHIVAAADSQGSYAFLYVPTADQSFTVDLGALRAGSVKAWWYDPRNGIGMPAGQFEAASGQKQRFTSPSYGPDWVLVLDSATAGYPAPGLHQHIDAPSAAPALAQERGSGPAQPVVLSTDIGSDVDDVWALAQLLRSPALQLKMVLTETGEARYRGAVAAKILECAQRTDVEIALGLDQGRMTDADKLSGPWVRDYDLARYPGRVHENGVQAFVDLISKSKEPVTVIAIGPVPSLAAALRANPDLAKKCRFVGMHGSFNLGYDGAPGAVPETNVRLAPQALREVLGAPWREIVLTPLDTCGLIRLKEENYHKVWKATHDPLLRAVIENTCIFAPRVPWMRYDDFSLRSSVLFDCVAVHLAQSQRHLKMTELRFDITEDGFTRETKQGPFHAYVALSWQDQSAFEDELAATLCRKPTSPEGVKP